MFDFDSFREIISTIRKNKLRTALTGLAVAWGIFMLILLLGAGNGLKNGVTSNFSDRAQNSISLWPGWTSQPYNGFPANREIKFDQRDYDLIRYKLPNIEYVSARTSKSATVSYGKEYGTWRLDGVSRDFAFINNIIINGQGRFLNNMDMDNKRKVVVISEDMQKVLFKNEDPLGKHIIADDIAYQVIGVYAKRNQFDNNPPAYIPFTTAQFIYNKGWGFRQIEFTIVGLNTVKETEDFVTQVRFAISKLHNFNPEDRSALYVRNMAQQVEETNDMFDTINLFVLVIGVCSLMAGIVGVGNIMLITVKERTREIGIRKAIGASPASVLRLIISEAIFITSISGYFGLVAGISLTEAVNSVLLTMQTQEGPTVFKDPTVDLPTVIGATLFLIVAGVVAGLIPALKATKVSPIEAMRAE